MENDLLALESNIFGPFDESSQVTPGLNVTTWSKVYYGRQLIQSLCGSWVAERKGERFIPMPKFLGVASNRGFLVVLDALEVAKGAGAGFLVDLDLAFGGYFIE
jgi:hypothetical protein